MARLLRDQLEQTGLLLRQPTFFPPEFTGWLRHLIVDETRGPKPVLTASATWDPPALAASAPTTSTTVSVPGAVTRDTVTVTHEQIGANDVLLSAHVQSADTVRVTLRNETGGTLDIGTGALRVVVHLFRKLE